MDNFIRKNYQKGGSNSTNIFTGTNTILLIKTYTRSKSIIASGMPGMPPMMKKSEVRDHPLADSRNSMKELG